MEGFCFFFFNQEYTFKLKMNFGITASRNLTGQYLYFRFENNDNNESLLNFYYAPRTHFLYFL